MRNALPDHVLLVEDSILIALDTEENLRRLGVPSVDVASSVASALAAIDRREPDLAIVDFNLGSETAIPVTQELARRGVPFVLATGYAKFGENTAEIGTDTVLSKPYGHAEIEAVLNEYGGRAGGKGHSAPSAEPDISAG
jgi:DNA-binding response OmpR family regulator